MYRRAFNPVSPQQKIIRTSNKFGNRGIKKQQGTTRIIYDSLPHDGRDDYRFFEGVGTRVFPETNLAENKLSVGEAMVVERMYIMLFTQIAGVYTNIVPITGQNDFLGATFELNQGNVNIVKPIPVASFAADFNKDAKQANHTNFEMDTQLVIEPLIEFFALVRVSSSVVVANEFVRLVIEGAGSILAPRNTF